MTVATMQSVDETALDAVIEDGRFGVDPDTGMTDDQLDQLIESTLGE